MGEVAFVSTLVGPGVDQTNYQGLFATDGSGNLNLVMRMGDQYNLGGDNLKTVNGVGLLNDLTFIATNGDGINDVGQLSLQVSFTDNTQAAVIATLPVPEPSSLVLGIVASIIIFKMTPWRE